VVFGFTTQPNDNAQNYSYDFTTGRLADLATHHDANLGTLEFNRVYYIRIISRTADGATGISPESVFIPIPGTHTDLNATSSGAASALATIGRAIMSDAFILVLLIMVIVVMLYLIIKRRAETR